MLQYGLLGDRHLQHAAQLLHAPGEVHGFDDEFALAGIGQHLPRQFRSPLHRFLDHLDVRSRRLGGGQFSQCQVGVAHDPGQDVVEIMGDAAGQDTQAFQFLGMPKLPFSFPQRRFGSFLVLDKTPLLDHSLDDAGQQIQPSAAQVLDNVVIRAQFHGLDGNFLVTGARDHHRGRERPVGGDGPQHAEAVAQRHCLIDGQEIVTAPRILHEGLFTVIGRIDHVSRLSETLLDEQHQVAVVLDIQDAQWLGLHDWPVLGIIVACLQSTVYRALAVRAWPPELRTGQPRRLPAFPRLQPPGRCRGVHKRLPCP